VVVAYGVVDEVGHQTPHELRIPEHDTHDGT
jgi:hypothetical protein